MSGVDEKDPRLEEALAVLAETEVREDPERLDRAKDAIRRDVGLLATLRSLPTPARVALAGAVLLALGAAVGLFSAREDLGVYPPARLAVEAGASVVFALLLAGVALRGPHRPAPAPLLTWVLAAAAVAVPAVLAMLPPADLMLPGAKGSEGSFVSEVMACFLYGSAAALPVLGTIAVLQRLPPTRARVSALAAAGAGLGGVLALQMHCPIALRDHLLLGHATVPLAAMLLILLVRRALGRDPE